MDSTKMTLRASETAVTHPFSRLEGFFANSAISISAEHDFDESEVFSNEGFELDSAIIKVNVADDFGQSLDLDEKDALVSFVQSNRFDREYLCHFTKHVSEVNGLEIPLAEFVQERRTIESNRYHLILHQMHQKPGERFKVYCRKTFSGRGSSIHKTFPRVWMTPEQFRAQGLDGNTPWYIQWRGSDLELPLDKLVVLGLNKKYEVRLMKMLTHQDDSATRALFAAEVFTSVLTPVLKKGLGDENYRAEAVAQALAVFAEHGVSTEALEHKLGGFEFDSFVAGWCKRFVRIDEELGATA